MSKNVSRESTIDIRPWYQEPMIWLVIAIPGSSVLAGFTLLSLAIISWDGLVVDDYYQHGKEINRVVARDRVASERKLHAVMSPDFQSGVLTVVMSSSAGDSSVVADRILRVRFVHRTRSGLDFKTAVHLQASHSSNPDTTPRFMGELQQLPDGEWYVHIDALDWRLVRNVTLPVEQAIQFRPTD